MFNSRGKCAKVATVTSAAVDSWTQKIICPTTHEGDHTRSMPISLDKMAVAMTKVVSAMTMQSCPKTSKDIQYQGASNYKGRQ